MADGRSPGYDRVLGELYRARIEDARANPPTWDAPISQGSARVFEALEDEFAAADVVAVVDPSDYGLEDAADWLADWVARGMAAEPAPGAFAKTGERPYRTDQGMLS
ncbi:hypothetical protein [Rubrivirga sp.]|uniref:hypothetical protein n=1 Tax=Rubrivirga sp. TaxID=1885344 RepID=UPI003C71E9E0